jgi:hypothetical protein
MNCWICKKRLWFWQKDFGRYIHLKCFTKEFFEGRMSFDICKGIIWDEKE